MHLYNFDKISFLIVNIKQFQNNMSTLKMFELCYTTENMVLQLGVYVSC